jgi:hypothetical protein
VTKWSVAGQVLMTTMVTNIILRVQDLMTTMTMMTS